MDTKFLNKIDNTFRWASDLLYIQGQKGNPMYPSEEEIFKQVINCFGRIAEIRQEIREMKKPTKEQVKAEAKKLEEMKPKVRRYSMFGDDNWAAIEAQVRVLEEDLDYDEIYDTFQNSEDRDEGDDEEDNTNELDAALDARCWMDGDEEETCSSAWESLVEKK